MAMARKHNSPDHRRAAGFAASFGHSFRVLSLRLTSRSPSLRLGESKFQPGGSNNETNQLFSMGSWRSHCSAVQRLHLPTPWSTGMKSPCRRYRPDARVPSASSTSRSCRLRCTMPCRRSISNSSRITRRSARGEANGPKVVAPLPLPRRRTTCSSASTRRRRQRSTRRTSTTLRTRVSTVIPGSSSDSRSPRAFFRCAA